MDSTNPKRGAPLPQSRFAVVLVEPQYPDNIGHAARAMLNFDVGEMILVNAGEMDESGRDRAVHAQDVLNQARRVQSLDEIRGDFEHIVGFAARISTLDKAHLRMSESLGTVARRLDEMGGRVALVFGREDFGLSNEDIARCDMLCTIPTSPNYRSMNLSHAVTVALYEFTGVREREAPSVTMATHHEKGVLFSAWDHLTGALGFKPHRRRQSLQMFQRLVGRAGLTSWEYHRFMGVLSRGLKRLGAWPPPGVGDSRQLPPDDVDDDVDDEGEDAASDRQA